MTKKEVEALNVLNDVVEQYNLNLKDIEDITLIAIGKGIRNPKQAV